MPHLALDDVALALAGLDAAQLQQLQRREDRRQRVPQLVAQHREELVLGAVGGFGGRAQAVDVAARDHLRGDVVADDHDAGHLAAHFAQRLVDVVEVERVSGSPSGRSNSAGNVVATSTLRPSRRRGRATSRSPADEARARPSRDGPPDQLLAPAPERRHVRSFASSTTCVGPRSTVMANRRRHEQREEVLLLELASRRLLLARQELVALPRRLRQAQQRLTRATSSRAENGFTR